MKYTLRERVEYYISTGLTTAQAGSFVAQQVLLSKIAIIDFINKL